MTLHVAVFVDRHTTTNDRRADINLINNTQNKEKPHA